VASNSSIAFGGDSGQRVGIPLVDIGPFRRNESGGDAVVAAVEAACRDTGFFLVRGHGVAPDLTARLYDAARVFFDQPAAWKRMQGQGAAVTGGLSFAPLGAETLAATRGDIAPGDYKESLNFGPRLPGGSWPDRPAGLAAAFADYFRAMEDLALTLRRILCRAIGLPADHFEPAFAAHLSALRVIDYPEQSTAPLPGQLRAGAHTDYGFMTILRSEASSGGLQVQTRDGRWIDVPAIDDAYVINIADALMRWTNDTWVSTPHRVANPPRGASGATRRQSIPFFVNPGRDTLIDCLPAFRGPGRPARYAPITYGDYIDMRTRQAFDR
jgi:isopenicillin N synthase-like dioxygenase